MFDNGFHQILPLPQIKMRPRRALTIFLFICSPHTHHGECHRICGANLLSQAFHTQGEVNLHLIGDCLILPIADSLSRYRSQSCSSRIWSCGCARVWGSDGRCGPCPGSRTWDITPLEHFLFPVKRSQKQREKIGRKPPFALNTPAPPPSSTSSPHRPVCHPSIIMRSESNASQYE